jgi:hypothetical protein
MEGRKRAGEKKAPHPSRERLTHVRLPAHYETLLKELEK